MVVIVHTGTQNLFLRSLRVSVPMVAVLLVIFWVLYRSEIDAQYEIYRINDRHLVQLTRDTVSTELSILQGDVGYLAEQTVLRRWLDNGMAADHQLLSNDLVSFVINRKTYDQIRLIDNQGMERIRINWNDGQPSEVSAEVLQNKSGRYYVDETLRLDQGQTYVSPFDLNIEKGQIQTPLKPVIRVGAPIFDSQGRKHGMIVVNYLGQRLLSRLRDAQESENTEIWLLNNQGYWLLGPNPEMEWGFMYPQREDVRIQAYHPRAWEAIQSGSVAGQVIFPQGIYSYTRIQPTILGPGNDNDWVIVAYTSKAAISAVTSERTSNLFIVFGMLLVLAIIIGFLLARKDRQRELDQARVRESESRFRGLFNSAPDGILIVDGKGIIQSANAQAEKWFGYGKNELVGKAIEQLVPERFRDGHEKLRSDYIEKPSLRPMGLGIDLYGQRKDGSEFPLEISLSPMATERGVLVTSIIRDISARKHAEKVRRQVQAQYQQLVTNLPIGVYRHTFGEAGRFMEVNPSMVDMFEARSSEELIETSLSDLFCDSLDLQRFNDKIMSSTYLKAEEFRLKTLAGREFDAAVTAILKEDGAGRLYLDGIVEDISERKEHEREVQQLNQNLQVRSRELEAINSELEAFSYSVSHDLRAPLRAIDGFSHMLLKNYSDSLDEQGQDRLNRVRAAAQRMATLIDDLLKLSRISRSELSIERVNLTDLANEVADSLHQQDPGREADLSFESDMYIDGDRQLLRVVLDNLLGNAWKFTCQQDHACIEMGTSSNNGSLHYFIRDNGAGFDMAYADKLFGAFQRLHDASEYPGTGIGLATVQRVINKHGGRIWARSEIGKGATFYFTLDREEMLNE